MRIKVKGLTDVASLTVLFTEGHIAAMMIGTDPGDVREPGIILL